MTIKLNLCSGGKKYPEYLNVDIDLATQPDIVASADNLSEAGDIIPEGGVDEILIEAGLEHLYRSQRIRAYREWLRVLKPNGKLVIRWLPDAEQSAMYFVRQFSELSELGPTEEFPKFDLEMLSRIVCGATGLHSEQPYQVHKDIFSKDSIRRELSKNGFIVDTVINEIYPGESISIAYNISIVAHKPEGERS